MSTAQNEVTSRSGVVAKGIASILESKLSACARECMKEAEWDLDRAMDLLIARIRSDKDLLNAAVARAARDEVLHIASTKRTQAHSRGAISGRSDDARGLAVLRNDEYLETYLLLGSLRLGDGTREDVEEFVTHHCGRVQSSQIRIKFGRRLLASPKFKLGKKVRECFSEIDIRRMLEQK
jgi:hypothetical protein